MAQAIPAPLFHTEPGSQSAPSELDIAKMESPITDTDFAGPIRSGIEVGRAAVQDLQESEELEKAREFEKILEAGLPAMQEALEEMKGEYDVSQIPDPRLFTRSKDDVANWYKGLKTVKDRQDQQNALTEGRPEEAIAIGVGRGEEKPVAASKQIDVFGRRKEAKELMEDAFSPQSVKMALSPEFRGVPQELIESINTLTPKVGVSPNVIAGIIGRESAFKPDAKNPNSTASGLGQTINATGKANHKELLAKGLVEGEYDPFDPEKSILYTANEFQKNMSRFGGNIEMAMLSHRMGPKVAERVLKQNGGEWQTATYEVNGKDITADVRNWMSDVITTSAMSMDYDEFEIPGQVSTARLIDIAGEKGLSAQEDIDKFITQRLEADKLQLKRDKAGRKKQLTEKTAMGFGTFNTMAYNILQLEQELKKIPQYAKGGVTGRITGKIPVTAIQNIERLRNVISVPFIKNVLGEVGNLNEGEQKRAMMAIADVRNNPQAAKDSIEDFKTSLQLALELKLGLLEDANRDVAKIKARMLKRPMFKDVGFVDDFRDSGRGTSKKKFRDTFNRGRTASDSDPESRDTDPEAKGNADSDVDPNDPQSKANALDNL